MPLKIKNLPVRNWLWRIPVIALFVVTGCHKPDNAAQTSPPADAASTNVPLAPGVGTRADNAVRETVTGEMNPFLTEQLHIFIQQKGRLPQSFTEFVQTRLDSVPRPPAGKKWAIDSTSNEVKAMDAQ